MSEITRKSAGSRGIQSVEVGGQLLVALAHHGRPMALKDLAQAAEMPAAKAHPYLVSFIKLGLVAQELEGGRYGLGPLALQLGLISLQQYDPVRLATPRIEELAVQLGHSVAIAVWGNRGPTVVRVAEAPSPVHVSMRHGTVMSLRGTASGLVFAAHLPRAMVRAALASAGERASLDAAFEAALDQVRKEGVATTRDAVVHGVSALAAPVFDDKGSLALCLIVLGPSGAIDLKLHGAVAPVLKQVAEALSRQLGCRG
ncbi:MAG TPA: IclR family transcriptional regulator [Burkholderiaceae bacterium]